MGGFFNHKLTLWALLAVPSVLLMAGVSRGAMSVEEVLHPTGELSTRLMVIALLASPLVLMFPRAGWARWLLRRRRYLGVAAFGYAFLHVVFYLLHKGAGDALGEALEPALWTGWAAFFIFLPLALTSNQFSVAAMGPAWKQLQRLVYAAAILTLVHWVLLHGLAPGLIVTFTPLVFFEGYRIYRWLLPKQQSA